MKKRFPGRSVPLFLALLLCLLPFSGCIRRDRLPGGSTEADPTVSAFPPTDRETDSAGAPLLLHRSGQVRSAESRYLVLIADWDLISYDGKSAQVEVKVRLSHYSISVGARPEMGSVTVNGARRTFSTPTLHMTENEKSETFFAGFSFPLALTPDGETLLSVCAEWEFNGTYHEEQIGTLRAACSERIG